MYLLHLSFSFSIQKEELVYKMINLYTVTEDSLYNTQFNDKIWQFLIRHLKCEPKNIVNDILSVIYNKLARKSCRIF